MSQVLAFENWLIRNGKKPRTIDRHKTNLNVLLRTISKWEVSCLDEFIIGLVHKGLKNATLNSYIDTIRLYARFCGYTELESFKHFKKEKFIIRPTLTPEEIELFLDAPCPKGANPEVFEKDTMFFYCVSLTGCRPIEIARLQKKDIRGDVLTINDTKTGRPRLIPIMEPLKTKLFEYVQNLKSDQLFVTNNGKVYSDSNWWHSFRKRMQLVGISKPNLSLYSLRHSMGTELYRKKTGAKVISKLLGNSVEMVENTYAHMVLDDVIDALKQHPLIRKHSTPENILNELRRIIVAFELDADDRFNFDLDMDKTGLHLDLKLKAAKSEST